MEQVRGYHERIAEITHPPRAAAVKDKTQPHPLVIPPSVPHCPPSLHSRHSPRPHLQNTSRPQSSQTPLLSLAPDRIYAMVVVAVMLIVRHQVAAYEFGRRRSIFESPPAGLTRQADIDIRRIVKNMGPFSIARTSGGGGDHRDDGYAESRDGGRSAEHAVVRYAEIIDALLRVWEEKHSANVYALSSNENPSQAYSSVKMSWIVRLLVEASSEICLSQQHSDSIRLIRWITSQHHNPSGYHPHQQYQQPSHYAPQHPTHNPTPLFRLHTNHTQYQSQHPHYAPPNPPPTHNIEMDLSLLSTDLFSDAAAAFAWDGLGSLDWSLGLGNGVIRGTADGNAGGDMAGMAVGVWGVISLFAF
ncbi:hypothetical protein M422DRAFT_243738 [Sphaerobolus stellatus SS14]|nr:hypothetical protein M422DRAFT_243738 [Sphaerobolus stellatus SS14]